MVAIIILAGFSACSLGPNADESALVGTWVRDLTSSYYTYDKLVFISGNYVANYPYATSTSAYTNNYHVTGGVSKVLTIWDTLYGVAYTNYSLSNVVITASTLTFTYDYWSFSSNVVFTKQ